MEIHGRMREKSYVRQLIREVYLFGKQKHVSYTKSRFNGVTLRLHTILQTGHTNGRRERAANSQ